jgi:hypothetical protein
MIVDLQLATADPAPRLKRVASRCWIPRVPAAALCAPGALTDEEQSLQAPGDPFPASWQIEAALRPVGKAHG